MNVGGGGGVQKNLLYFLRALGVVRLHRVPIREIKRANIYRYSFDLIFYGAFLMDVFVPSFDTQGTSARLRFSVCAD